MQNPFGTEEGKAAIQRRLEGVKPETVMDYIEDAWARAVENAPCIASDSFPPENQPEKALFLVTVLRGIILRWHELSTQGITGAMAGPYQVQFGAPTRKGYNLIPAEVVDLQKLCRKKGRPFSVDTMPDDVTQFFPLSGVVINGDTETLNGPPGEWSPDAPELDV